MMITTTPARNEAAVAEMQTADARSRETRRSVWAMLLRSPAHTSTGHELKPGGMHIASEVGRIILREGVTGRVLTPLGELLELGTTQLAPVIGVDRTTARRYVRDDQMLPTHSAEAVLRLAELEAFATDVFATGQAAHDWLKSVHPLLGESPIEAASTSYGAQRVREILTAIKHGGVV